MTNPAFELLRNHKQVTEETETLVLKKSKGRISQSEMLSAFENGITGKYGKVYSCDPQTLIGWIDSFQKEKNSKVNYLSTGLVPVSTPSWETIDWDKEANKCFTAFLNGVKEDNFHPCVYDRLMIDGKIKIDSCMKFLKKGYTDQDVKEAKQRVLRDVFLTYKSNGWNQVYFIS